MYELYYSNSSARFIKKLPREKQERILAVLERARIRPETHFEKLVGDKAYKLRIGDYRVLADIYKDKLIILVVKVGHRKNIYKQ